jgi:histidinol dehydrogenase
VYTFLKRSSVEQYPDGMDEQTIDDIARLAEAEGLEAHAHSARKRTRT